KSSYAALPFRRVKLVRKPRILQSALRTAKKEAVRRKGSGACELAVEIDDTIQNYFSLKSKA
ncbi:MAG: hypothetical protein OXU72_19735, partial [Gammaproteobacteria bacterium]|nr:hypothetical protein [Gammaproteobacteria bacterium]